MNRKTKVKWFNNSGTNDPVDEQINKFIEKLPDIEVVDIKIAIGPSGVRHGLLIYNVYD
jgi:hypothetical protein